MKSVVDFFLLVSVAQEVAVCMDQMGGNIQPDAQSLESATSLNLESKVRANNQHRISKQDTSDQHGKSGERKHFTSEVFK